MHCCFSLFHDSEEFNPGYAKRREIFTVEAYVKEREEERGGRGTRELLTRPMKAVEPSE